MENPEAILNLWYVYDESGVVYYLLAKAYAATGSAQEKLDLLHKLAGSDHLTARYFQLPERFHTRLVSETGERTVPVIRTGDLPFVGGAIALFHDAITELEKSFPAVGGFRIAENPLYCLTPVLLEVNGKLIPQINRDAEAS